MRTDRVFYIPLYCSLYDKDIRYISGEGIFLSVPEIELQELLWLSTSINAALGPSELFLHS